MASAMTIEQRLVASERSPLRVTGTSVPATWLAVAKGTTLLLLALGYAGALGEPFLPIVGIIDSVPGALWSLALHTAVVAGAILLFSNLAVRAGATLVGLAFLLGVVGDQTSYRNAVVWAGCILVLVGLYQDGRSKVLMRAQFAVLYAGSSLSKLADPDWRDGTFVEHWRFDGAALYDRAAELAGVELLAVVVAWTVIAVEGLLACLYLMPRLRNVAVATALIFHTTPVVINDLTFGIFFPALALANLALFDLPGTQAGRFDVRRPWREPAAYVVLTVAYVAARVAKRVVIG